MTEKEIKRELEDCGLRIADLARSLAGDYGVSVKSADNMLRDLIAGRRWYPTYAKWLDEQYQITVTPPVPFAAVRERMKLAA